MYWYMVYMMYRIMVSIICSMYSIIWYIALLWYVVYSIVMVLGTQVCMYVLLVHTTLHVTDP